MSRRKQLSRALWRFAWRSGEEPLLVIRSLTVLKVHANRKAVP
jgi:hypothetical protein